MNVIDMQLSDTINSGRTRWRLAESMDAVVESVGIPGVSTRLNLCVENTQADPGRDGRICLARHKSQARKGTGNNNFPYSADHEQD